jgi:(2Fe-2S) ferredoxin
MVIYPEGIWYTFSDTDDIEEIIQSHLIKGKSVERLLAA